MVDQNKHKKCIQRLRHCMMHTLKKVILTIITYIQVSIEFSFFCHVKSSGKAPKVKILGRIKECFFKSAYTELAKPISPTFPAAHIMLL